MPSLSLTGIRNIINWYEDLSQKALSVANHYTRMAREFQKQHGNFPHHYPQDQFDKFEGISNGTFECSYEYNSACHCHPEYQTWREHLPLEWLTLDGDELDKAITKRLEKDYAQYQAYVERQAKKKAAEDARKVAEAEERQRKQYEKLKQKYEGTKA